jgi:uncharacterized membrane protein
VTAGAPVWVRIPPVADWGHTMTMRKRAHHIHELDDRRSHDRHARRSAVKAGGERLAHDRHAQRSALKAADSATALRNDLKRHGLRHVILSDRTSHHLGVIAEAAGDIARRGTKQSHRRWPWLVGAGAVVAGGAAALRLRGGTTTMVGAASSGKGIVSAVDVDVPVRAAYDQWTHFEDFPSFMSTIDEVVQLDETHLRWRASVAGVERAWTAEVTEQLPDQRVAWISRDGGPSGVVTFHRLHEGHCRITAQIGYEPDGLREQVGNLLGIDSIQVQHDLRRFKDLVESGVTTTGWRGTVAAGRA